MTSSRVFHLKQTFQFLHAELRLFHQISHDSFIVPPRMNGSE